MRKPLRILCAFGTRPEAIKLAPVVLQMRDQRDAFRPIACVTGQHRKLAILLPGSTTIRPAFRL